jgi:single-strand DNA-binding protein
MNNAVLGGIIVIPPQLRHTTDNKTVCIFELGFVNPSKSESIKNIRCVSFGKIAEAIAQLQQSQNLIVIGSINIIKREQNGNKVYLTEFKINNFEAVSSPININSVNIVGRIGQDTDMKYFESGTNKATNSLAVRRYQETDWFSLEAWGKTAEVMGNYVRKGGLIGVMGELKFEEWNDRNSGELRSKAVIKVNQLDLLGSKQEQREEF